MRREQGFTLTELMVVILIVGILVVAAIPIMRGRLDTARWSEGKSIMGTIATALRTHIAEQGSAFTKTPSLLQLGFTSNDLDGAYFEAGDFAWTISGYNPVAFTITATAPASISSPKSFTLDQTGTFTGK